MAVYVNRCNKMIDPYHIYVHLLMFINYKKRLLPRCQVARYIRFPKVSPQNTYKTLSHVKHSLHSSGIHIVRDEKYATLYYITKNVVYFHNTKFVSLRSIVPLYHYTSGKYFFQRAGIGYKPDAPIPQFWYTVRAPNGDIYIVYVSPGPCDNGDALCIYNLTKSKVVHCVSNSCRRIKEDSLYVYSRFIANSFVLIHVVIDHKHRIDLVDLVSEKVDTINYTLHDYLKGLFTVVDDEREKKRFVDVFSEFNRLRFYIENSICWTFAGAKYMLNNCEHLVPFVKYYELRFEPDDMGAIKFDRRGALLAMTCRVENNELFLEFTTGTGGVIKKLDDPSFKITIPANTILFSKRYVLDDRYDISKSYPYYIQKITPEYILTVDHVLKRHDHDKCDYIMHSKIKYDYNYPHYSVNGITIVELNDRTIIQIKRADVKDEKRFGVHVIGDKTSKGLLQAKSLTFVNLLKAYQFLHKKMYAQNEYSESFVDASQFMFKVDIEEKIRHILGLEEEEVRSMSNHLTHFVYVDVVEGALYILIVLYPQKKKNDEKDTVFWLCKCNVLKPKEPCEVIAKIRLNSSGKVKGFIKAAEHNVHLLELLNNLIYRNTREESAYAWTYIYDNTLIKVSDTLDIKIKDIRQNRTNILQYVKQIPVHESNFMYCYVYQDECVICEIETEPVSICYPFVFTELKLVKSIQLN